MKRQPNPYWIKERHNPQTGVYYVGMGQMSVTKARQHARPIYGANLMHEYPYEADYLAKLEELRKRGLNVQ